jgi:hypothetical protein
MEDALRRYSSEFHGHFTERQFCDIFFAFQDGTGIVAAHRHVMVAASPYMRNKIELMTELGLSAATEGSSREKPWVLDGIDKRGFEIVVDFMYHPRDLSKGISKDLDDPMSPTIARAVFKAAHLLLMPVVQAMMFKVLAAQLTPANCLGALQFVLQSKEQWARLEGQGEALCEQACKVFALKTVEATNVALRIASGENEPDDEATLSFSLANCDINFFEALFSTSFPLKDAVACNAFFSLILEWHRLGNPGESAVQLLRVLSEDVKDKPSAPFAWRASAQEFLDLDDEKGLHSPDFDVYGHTFHLDLQKHGENAGLYLVQGVTMPGWLFGYRLSIKEAADLPGINVTFDPLPFLVDSDGFGETELCSAAKLFPGSEDPSYVTDGTIEITCSIDSTSLVRLASAFLVDNFESLIEDELFCTISESLMTTVLPFDELRVSSELELLQALFKWNGTDDDLTEDMLKWIRLSQINFQALLDEVQVHTCLQTSAICKKFFKEIVKKASVTALPSSQRVGASSTVSRPRLHAKVFAAKRIGCSAIVKVLTDPSPLRKCMVREKELELKLAAMESRLSKLAEASARGLLVRAGLRARCRLQARKHNQVREAVDVGPGEMSSVLGRGSEMVASKRKRSHGSSGDLLDKDEEAKDGEEGGGPAKSTRTI